MNAAKRVCTIVQRLASEPLMAGNALETSSRQLGERHGG